MAGGVERGVWEEVLAVLRKGDAFERSFKGEELPLLLGFFIGVIIEQISRIAGVEVSVESLDWKDRGPEGETSLGVRGQARMVGQGVDFSYKMRRSDVFPGISIEELKVEPNGLLARLGLKLYGEQIKQAQENPVRFLLGGVGAMLEQGGLIMPDEGVWIFLGDREIGVRLDFGG